MNSDTTSGELVFWNLSQEPPGKSMEPGAMQLTRTLVGASCKARCLENAISPALPAM